MKIRLSPEQYSRLFAGETGAVFLKTAANKERYSGGRRVHIYKKGRGETELLGEAIIQERFSLEKGFPHRKLFQYWAKNVCKDAELALRIEQIGEYKSPDYRDDFVFMVALDDDEYWEYISKMGKLPETYNDMMYDYLIHPEHAHAREKSHAVLRDYDKWLESMGAYDRYGRLRCKTCLVLSDIRKY